MLGWFVDPNKLREMIPNFDEQVFCGQMAWQQKNAPATAMKVDFSKVLLGRLSFLKLGVHIRKLMVGRPFCSFWEALLADVFFFLGGGGYLL